MKVSLKEPAEYQCVSCKYRFKLLPTSSVVCIQCGHKYLTWLNFNKAVKYANK